MALVKHALWLFAVAMCIATPSAAQDHRPFVAFLGPLSGDYAAIGRRAFQAVTFAANEQGVLIEAFDTDALGVAEAFAAAIEAQPHAIIGPVGEQESRVVANLVEPAHPPTFLLTGVAGIENADRGVFRLRTSPGDQASALAAAMFGEGGAPSFAVLAPQDAYGQEAAQAFVRTTVANGGSIVRVVAYDPEEPDVSDAVEVLVGQRALRLDMPSDPWRSSPRQRVTSRGGDRTRPEGVFIPEFARQVAATLPHLAFHEWLTDEAYDSVGLLGISGWASEGLAAAGDLAADAYVIRIFSAEDPSAAAEAFALEWSVRFDDTPTAFEAQAYDAAGFVFRALAQASDSAPVSVRAAARDVYAHAGVCGNMWLSPAGGVRRQLGLWQVDAVGGLYPIGMIEPPNDAGLVE